jgi:mono/diheme cytochrome c family protein
MRRSVRNGLLAAALVLPAAVAAYFPQPSQAGASSNDDPVPPTSPVASSSSSIAEGRQLFAKQCATCHGPGAKGDGKSGLTLNPRPANLTDETWKHGSTDGEIFLIIRDGVQQTGMRGFSGRLTSREMWNIVNYLRTLRARDRIG